MRRIVQPSRVIYVNRNRELSLILLVGALIAGVLAAAGWERRLADATAVPFMAIGVVGGAGLLTAALILLLRQRAFIVDAPAGTLLIMERRFVARTSRVIPLTEVGVHLTRKIVDNLGKTGLIRKTTSKIWITLSGRERILFLDDILGEEGPDLARRLAADLHCSALIESG